MNSPANYDSSSSVDGQAVLRSLKTLAGALMGSLVIIGFALAAVLRKSSASASTPIWIWIVIVAMGAVESLVIRAVGYPTLPPGSCPNAVALRQLYRAGMMLRFALSESVAIVSIALAFIDPAQNLLVYALGAAISLALLALHVWPSPQLIRRVQTRMNARGVQADLLAAFGLR